MGNWQIKEEHFDKLTDSDPKKATNFECLLKVRCFFDFFKRFSDLWSLVQQTRVQK